MRHTYLSLGTACNAAIMLQKLGLRTESLPFDWLWNIEGGIPQVTRIIASNFATITGEDAYTLGFHPRFPGENVLYRNHTNIVHPHSDPLRDPKARETLERRMARFKNLLRSDNTLHFVVYEIIEGVDPQALTHRIDQLVRDVAALVNTLDAIAANPAKLCFAVGVETNIENLNRCKMELRRIQPGDPRVQYGCIATRNDDIRLDKVIWHRHWATFLFTKTRIPLARAPRCIARIVETLAREARLRLLYITSRQR